MMPLQSHLTPLASVNQLQYIHSTVDLKSKWDSMEYACYDAWQVISDK